MLPQKPAAICNAAKPNLEPTYSRIEPYRKYNFAIFKTVGLAHVFDTLRYDRAFIVRPADVATLMKLTPDATLNEPIELLVCKYDWRDKMHPPLQNFHSTSPLKIRSDVQITGTIPQIMAIMYNNMAMPCEEPDANALEAAFMGPDRDQQSLTLRLTTFMAAEIQWKQ